MRARLHLMMLALEGMNVRANSVPAHIAAELRTDRELAPHEQALRPWTGSSGTDSSTADSRHTGTQDESILNTEGAADNSGSQRSLQCHCSRRAPLLMVVATRPMLHQYLDLRRRCLQCC